MENNVHSLMLRVKDFMSGEDISLLFLEMKKDLINQILHTQPDELAKREELYKLTQALTLLERKMQEYVNELSKEFE